MTMLVQCIYMYMLMRDTKGMYKEANKAIQSKYNTPKAGIFPKKYELPRVGFKPTTFHTHRECTGTCTVYYRYLHAHAEFTTGTCTCTCRVYYRYMYMHMQSLLQVHVHVYTCTCRVYYRYIQAHAELTISSIPVAVDRPICPVR